MKFYIFYTMGTGYAKLAEDCQKSFLKFDLDVVLSPMPYLKRDWMHNCMLRSKGLLEFAKGEGIGLLDADLLCLKDPVLLKTFESTDYDVAVHDLGGEKQINHRFSAGVLAFNKGRGIECLRRWAELCEKDLHYWDEVREQIYLNEAITDFKYAGPVLTRSEKRDPVYKVLNVGPTYNYAIPMHEKAPPDTVIAHLVASRQLRPEIGGRP